MTKRKLDNLTFILDEDFTAPFSVAGYTFHPQDLPTRRGGVKAIPSKRILNENRQHKQNAYVEYEGAQENSIIFKGGRVGANQQNSRKRKFLEDLLVVGSILTAQNWQLHSRRDFAQYPAIPKNHLERISKNAEQCKKHLKTAMNKLKDLFWQKQFENGFHLVMLLNRANILNTETRFLSMVVVWEWLYPHLKNSNGATPSDKANNLHEIFTFILNKFWQEKINNNIFTNGKVNKKSKNIFYVLRNQLAHSGKLPIDRNHAEHWMTQILWERSGTTKGINDYLKFFDRLTQIVVLKTIDINGEGSLKAFNFTGQLDSFLSTGRI